MGIILSRFRRKRTSFEELERIEQKIQDIEKFKNETEQRQKKIVGKLVVYSVGLYIIAAALFYFLFFPASLRDRIFYMIPLLVFPIIVVFMKRLISWYYIRRTSKQLDLLAYLRSEKRHILETVKEKETYKVAHTILEKFAPDQLRNNSFNNSLNTKSDGRKKLIANPVEAKALVPLNVSSIISNQSDKALLNPESELRFRPGAVLSDVTDVTIRNMEQLAGITRPRPILPKETGLFDRLMENLVGDGPSYRYALICSHCHCHNGMALQEEFPFLAFRCCYCSFYNPSKKQRPISPKLQNGEEPKEPSCSSESDPDSDHEMLTKEQTNVIEEGLNETEEKENKIDCSSNINGVNLGS